MPGEWNTVADVLSRNPVYAPKCSECAARVEVCLSMVRFGTLPGTGKKVTQAWLNNFGCDVVMVNAAEIQMIDQLLDLASVREHCETDD